MAVLRAQGEVEVNSHSAQQPVPFLSRIVHAVVIADVVVLIAVNGAVAVEDCLVHLCVSF